MRFQRKVLTEFNKKILFYVCITKNKEEIHKSVFKSYISKSGLCVFYPNISVITSFYIWKNIKILNITFLSRLPVKKNLLSGLQSQDQIILLCTAVTLLVKAKRLKIGSERNMRALFTKQRKLFWLFFFFCLLKSIFKCHIQFIYADFCNRPRLRKQPLTRGYENTVIVLAENDFISTSHSLVADDQHLSGMQRKVQFTPRVETSSNLPYLGNCQICILSCGKKLNVPLNKV